MMNQRIVTVCGLGQLGQTFATGALKSGLTVEPIRRRDILTDREREALWVCVGEKDLVAFVEQIPSSYLDKCIFVQNGLFMTDIEKYRLQKSTFVQVWFSKKEGTTIDVIGQSIVHGDMSEHVLRIFGELSIPCQAPKDMSFEHAIAQKHAFILAFNLLGYRERPLIETLFDENPARVDDAIKDGCWLSHKRTGIKLGILDQEIIKKGLESLAQYPAGGRHARARIDRAIKNLESSELPITLKTVIEGTMLS